MDRVEESSTRVTNEADKRRLYKAIRELINQCCHDTSDALRLAMHLTNLFADPRLHVIYTVPVEDAQPSDTIAVGRMHAPVTRPSFSIDDDE